MPKHLAKGGKVPAAVRRKTEHLIEEGKDPDQAYAMAWSMHRKARLGPAGEYKRAKKRKKR